MNLKVVGAGLPRTGTSSLREALELLLGEPCLHMSVLPRHPFEFGEAWDRVLAGDETDLSEVTAGFVAAVDWPASLYWRELAQANPEALVILSVRDTPEIWWRSFDELVVTHTRMCTAPDWTEGLGLLRLMERFAGPEWDDAEKLKALYVRHNDEVRSTIPASRLLEWKATEGWGPVCERLGVAVPEREFPWKR